MTEGVWMVVVSNATVIIVIILSRYWSHKEHQKTEKKVDVLMNGRLKK